MNLANRNDIVRRMLWELADRSPWEAEHATRVAVYSVATGTVLGLSDRELLDLRYAATLHDIGKLSWPEAWFLPDAEIDFDTVRLHPIEGESRLRKVHFLRTAAKIVRQHHERCDGTGYPNSLIATEISLSAKVLAVCEAFDILRHGAPWAPASKDAFASLATAAFDPGVLEALRQVDPLIQPVGS